MAYLLSAQYFVILGVIAADQPISSHPAWKLLNSFDCGDSSADRIIGGSNAALGQFPWIARLGYTFTHTRDGLSVDWMCGGALITDRLVVTASHCLSEPDDNYALKYVRLGEHDNRTNPDCELSICAPPVQDRAIRNIIKHPLFNSPSFHNDIAILELDSPVEINDYVTPICLPQQKEQLATLRVGELVTAAGWGKMNMTTEKRADVLQVVSLPIVKPEVCEIFGKDFRVGESAICAGAQFNKDACGGDSGGPLMKVFDTDEGPKTFLIGIVSYGPAICGIRKPGVYTSITYYIKWILDTINSLNIRHYIY